jgi:CheY-like chemotaxis protein/DNA-binding XRE family transcriptional regulator
LVTEDEFIGNRLRELRKRQNLSQKDVAVHLDLSYQQIQQYENGSSRLPASGLYKLSRLFNVQVGFFFDGIEQMLQPQMKTDTINSTRKQPLKVLLVEDNAADEALMREILSEMPVHLEVVRDGEALLAKLNTMIEIGDPQRTELILLDLMLARTSGIELLATIKRNRVTHDIPVVVLTNSIHSEDVMRAYRAGAGGYMKKSPSLSDMQGQVERCVGYWSNTIMPSMQFASL